MNLPEIDICYAENVVEYDLDIEDIASKSIKMAIELSNIHSKPNSELSIRVTALDLAAIFDIHYTALGID